MNPLLLRSEEEKRQQKVLEMCLYLTELTPNRGAKTSHVQELYGEQPAHWGPAESQGMGTQQDGHTKNIKESIVQRYAVKSHSTSSECPSTSHGSPPALGSSSFEAGLTRMTLGTCDKSGAEVSQQNICIFINNLQNVSFYV